MLATVGYVATEFVHLPGAAYSVSPLAAHDAAVASGTHSIRIEARILVASHTNLYTTFIRLSIHLGAGFQVLTLIAGLEFIAIVAMQQMFSGSGRLPGDFGGFIFSRHILHITYATAQHDRRSIYKYTAPNQYVCRI